MLAISQIKNLLGFDVKCDSVNIKFNCCKRYRGNNKSSMIGTLRWHIRLYTFAFLECSHQFKNNFIAPKFNNRNLLHYSIVKWSLACRRRNQRELFQFAAVNFLSDDICFNIYKHARTCFIHWTHNSDNLCELIWNQWKMSSIQHCLDFNSGPKN